MSSQSPVRDRKRAGFELIETLRWQAGAGFVRKTRHLARLEASCDELGFVFDRARVEHALENAVADGPAWPLRVRLSVDAEGDPVCVTQRLVDAAPDAVWTLRIARTHLSSTDPSLRHKTSRRGAYDSARSEFSADAADEVLLLNERDELCEGTITSIFLDMGDGSSLATPALRCGLLAGVLRAELLEAGKSRETVLHRRDLEAARAIYVGNSLRGLIAARLAE